MVKNPPTTAGDGGDAGSVPRMERSPREGQDNPLQYSWLGNIRDREAWWVILHGVAKNQI